MDSFSLLSSPCALAFFLLQKQPIFAFDFNSVLSLIVCVKPSSETYSYIKGLVKIIICYSSTFNQPPGQDTENLFFCCSGLLLTEFGELLNWQTEPGIKHLLWPIGWLDWSFFLLGNSMQIDTTLWLLIFVNLSNRVTKEEDSQVSNCLYEHVCGTFWSSVFDVRSHSPLREILTLCVWENTLINPPGLCHRFISWVPTLAQ